MFNGPYNKPLCVGLFWFIILTMTMKYIFLVSGFYCNEYPEFIIVYFWDGEKCKVIFAMFIGCDLFKLLLVNEEFNHS